MKRLAATILAVFFLVPACERVWAIPFDSQAPHAVQASPSSGATADDSDRPSQFACGNHAPKSPCDNSEPQHFEIAAPPSEPTMQAARGCSYGPAAFSSGIPYPPADRKTKPFKISVSRVRGYADLVGIVMRLD